MTIAYFDCFSGVAGDMVLGAMVDCGLPFKLLEKQLKSLPLGEYKIRRVKSWQKIDGTNISVTVKKGPKFRDYKNLDSVIAKSRLSKNVKELAREIFRCLAGAEAKVHGTTLNRVHFHEVGVADSIIDVVGAAIGFEYFGFDKIYSSPLPITRGRVKCEHGVLPVPAPATLKILEGIPIETSPIKGEIVTPTGAAILKTVAEHFGECPLQKVEKVGYGFGDKIFPDHVNALRLMIGEGFPVVIVQTDIDDMNPQIFDYVARLLFEAGAVDVDLSAIQMKKGRPGIRLSALVPWNRKEKIIDLILKETTTFGVRYWPVDRKILVRKFVTKKTKYGSVNFKVGLDSTGNIIKAMPEFEDLRKLAQKKKVPLVDVYWECKKKGRGKWLRYKNRLWPERFIRQK